MTHWPAIADLVKDLKKSGTTAVSNVEKALSAIEEASEFKAIIATTKERALQRATQIDEMVAKGQDPGRLAGVPFIAKDNFLTFGSETTAASNILKGFNAPYQATVINKLEAEGAICVAKANLDAFAHGSSTENSDFFTTLNPHDKSRVPGGSSGGSAAAVALSMTPFALGTDTGGSIRLPASFCGLVGYKPSYGLVSRSGVIAMASSTDVIGPLTKTVDDAAIVLEVMSGKDGLDSTTIDRPKENYLQTDYSLKGKKVGIIKEYLEQGIDENVKQCVLMAIENIKAAGAQVSEVSLPSLPLALAVYYIICPAEVSSNLSRYDGQRFGFSETSAKNLDESYELSREKGFGAEAKRRIMVGTYVLSSGYYDAYYKKAQLVRTKVRQEFDEAFKNYDLLVGPTAPMTAFKIGERTSDPLQMYLTDIMTVAANIAGNPSISIPAGDAQGLPVGVQLIGDYGDDTQVLSAARALETQL
jgi:aspartyl-tRNA(Asn)/glutamyl-tRNA(Gln) amidotransferase subunit A